MGISYSLISRLQKKCRAIKLARIYMHTVADLSADELFGQLTNQ